MSSELSLDEILRRIESDAEKLEALCSEFQCLLTEEQLEEFSALDLEHNFEEFSAVDTDDTLSSDEEFFLSCDGNFKDKPPTDLSLTSSSSSSSSSGTARSYPSPASSRHSQGSENDNSHTALTAVSLAKVLLTGTIPRLKGAIKQYLDNPSSAQPGIDEIKEKFETFQRVTSEAFRRFTVLRQNEN